MKKLLTGLLVAAGLLSVSLLIKTDTVSAHGYVQSPPARGYGPPLLIFMEMLLVTHNL